MKLKDLLEEGKTWDSGSAVADYNDARKMAKTINVAVLSAKLKLIHKFQVGIDDYIVRMPGTDNNIVSKILDDVWASDSDRIAVIANFLARYGLVVRTDNISLWDKVEKHLSQ